jgi:hypothetical protein
LRINVMAHQDRNGLRPEGGAIYAGAPGLLPTGIGWRIATMSDTYQQAQDAMMQHSQQMQADQGQTAALHDASCRCGACFHAAQDQRMAEATLQASLAKLRVAQATTSTWRQCAEARAAQLAVAQATIAHQDRRALDALRERDAAQATIADLRAMLAAQQAVIQATPAVSDAIADALLYGHSAVRVTHVDMSDSPKHIVAVADSRSCTCHPSEAPVPCQRKYALSECKAAASTFPSRALRGGDGVGPVR